MQHSRHHRELGQVLGQKLRKSDIVCRYGGEEFVLVLPDSSLANAWQRLELIRVLVSELQIRHGEQLLGIMTVSAGIAQAHEHGSTARELLRAADDAMYAAKQAGRDRVVVYDMKGLPKLKSKTPLQSETGFPFRRRKREQEFGGCNEWF